MARQEPKWPKLKILFIDKHLIQTVGYAANKMFYAIAGCSVGIKSIFLISFGNVGQFGDGRLLFNAILIIVRDKVGIRGAIKQ